MEAHTLRLLHITKMMANGLCLRASPAGDILSAGAVRSLFARQLRQLFLLPTKATRSRAATNAQLSSWTGTLDAFNNGLIAGASPHCGETVAVGG